MGSIIVNGKRCAYLDSGHSGPAGMLLVVQGVRNELQQRKRVSAGRGCGKRSSVPEERLGLRWLAAPIYRKCCSGVSALAAGIVVVLFTENRRSYSSFTPFAERSGNCATRNTVTVYQRREDGAVTCRGRGGSGKERID